MIAVIADFFSVCYDYSLYILHKWLFIMSNSQQLDACFKLYKHSEPEEAVNTFIA